MDSCQLCEKRRPQRYCPGVRGNICARCCGEAREVNVDCPFECEYLMEARRHEKPREVSPDDIPHKEIEVNERFLRDVEPLLAQVSRILLDAATATPGSVDSDVREALESMIKTHLTAESGLIYESRPNNPFAGSLQQYVQAGTEQFRREVHEQTGVNAIRDKDVLGVLVFLQRLELHQNNGKRRGRAFLDFLRTNFVPPEPPPQEDSGIVTV